MFAELAIAKLKAEDAYDRDILLAWRVAFFSRLKTLGDPMKWLSNAGKETSAPQPLHQQKAVLLLLAEMGGKFTTRADREAAQAAKRKREH